MNRVSLFWADTAGNMAIMFAAAMTLGAILSAFAVDEIALYQERRLAQSAVDLAAIEAARSPEAALEAAFAVLGEQGIYAATVTLGDLQRAFDVSQGPGARRLEAEPGKYSNDPALSIAQRFTAGVRPYNAVRVRYTFVGTSYFSRTWSGDKPVTVEAVAATSPVVAFSVGSRLLSLKEGVANAVLNSLLGSSVSLTALDYNALVSTKVSLFGMLDGLAQQLGITAGTYDDVLKANADQGQLARAMAGLLNGAEKVAALKLAASLGHNGKVPLSRLFALGEWSKLKLGSGGNVPLVKLSALEVLAVTGAISTGSHQVTLALGANVPGLVGLTMSLAVGEPKQFAPWYRISQAGSVVRTAQLRLRLVAQLAGSPLLLNASVKVPVYLELAYAEAEARSATCPVGSAASGTARIAARPGLARLVLGEVGDPAFSDFASTPAPVDARLIDALLLKVTGSALVDIAQMQAKGLDFSASEIAAGTVKSVRTAQVVSSLVSSLLGSASLKVNLGIGIGLPSAGVVTAALKTLLDPLAPALDTVLDSTLNVLGLRIGEADVQVYGVRCPAAALVR